MRPLLPRDILISATLTWPGTLRYIGSHNINTMLSEYSKQRHKHTRTNREMQSAHTNFKTTRVVWYTQSVQVRYMGIGHGAVGTCTQSFGDVLSYGSSAF